jgi:NADH-quinone oxidoreductase subunit J
MPNPHYILLIATILGGLGMWLMLPRRTDRGRLIGTIPAVIALGLYASQMPGLGQWVAQSVFAILAGVTVVAATATVTFRNPVYCAVWFGLTLIGVAGLFLMSGAQFLAVATIVVYAGAILVTFLFVLMLAQPEGKAIYDRVSWEALVSATVGMGMVGILSITIVNAFCMPADTNLPAISASNSLAANTQPAEQLAQGVLTQHHVASFGAELFGRHLIAVEVAGTLLLAAIVGAAVIAAASKKNVSNDYGSS